MELSGLLRASLLHPPADRFPAFRNAAGVALKTANVATAHPAYAGVRTRGNRLDGVVVADFLAEPERMRAAAGEIRRLLQSGESDAALGPGEPEVAEATEGGLLMSVHLRRERSPRLREQKVASVRQAGLPVACEVCGFDFRTFYGERGDGYIEVHHVLPLHASGPRRTRLQDLALLCSNCHRMVHRGPAWLTPEQLRQLVSGASPATPPQA